MPHFNYEDLVVCVDTAGPNAFKGLGMILEHFEGTEAFPEVYRVSHSRDSATVLVRPENLRLSMARPLKARQSGKSPMPVSDSMGAVPRTVHKGMFSESMVLECQECCALTWNINQFRKHVAWHNTQVKLPDFLELRTEVLR